MPPPRHYGSRSQAQSGIARNMIHTLHDMLGSQEKDEACGQRDPNLFQEVFGEAPVVLMELFSHLGRAGTNLRTASRSSSKYRDWPVGQDSRQCKDSQTLLSSDLRLSEVD